MASRGRISFFVFMFLSSVPLLCFGLDRSSRDLLSTSDKLKTDEGLSYLSRCQISYQAYLRSHADLLQNPDPTSGEWKELDTKCCSVDASWLLYRCEAFHHLCCLASNAVCHVQSGAVGCLSVDDQFSLLRSQLFADHYREAATTTTKIEVDIPIPFQSPPPDVEPKDKGKERKKPSALPYWAPPEPEADGRDFENSYEKVYRLVEEVFRPLANEFLSEPEELPEATVAGMPVHVWKIGHPDVLPENRLKILIVGGLHGNEYLAVSMVLDFMHYLLRWSNEPDGPWGGENARRDVEFHFIPIVNRDGYDLRRRKNSNTALCPCDASNHDTVQRLEANLLANFHHEWCGIYGMTRYNLVKCNDGAGSDLNRAFPLQTISMNPSYNECDYASYDVMCYRKGCANAIPTSDSFSPVMAKLAGGNFIAPAPTFPEPRYVRDDSELFARESPYAKMALEPEVRALMVYAHKFQFLAAINLHDGADTVVTPDGTGPSLFVLYPPQAAKFSQPLYDKYCQSMADMTKNVYKDTDAAFDCSPPGSNNVGFLACGSLDEYLFVQENVFTVTLEIGAGNASAVALHPRPGQIDLFKAFRFSQLFFSATTSFVLRSHGLEGGLPMLSFKS